MSMGSNQADVVTSLFERYARDLMKDFQGTDNLFNDIAQDRVGYGAGYAMWCDFSASAMALMSGVLPAIVNYNGYTPTHLAQFKAKSCVVPTSQVQRGDYIFFDWHPNSGAVCDHVGIARGSMSATGTVPTVEGNTTLGGGAQWNGGRCAIRVRSRGDIRAVCRPMYGSQNIPTPFAWLGVGVVSDNVATVQRALGISVDRDYGPATRSAVKVWQTKNGRKATGYVNAETYRAITGSSNAGSSVPTSPAQPTTTRPALVKLPLQLDGDLGPLTIAAWQWSYVLMGRKGLTVDGEFSPDSALVREIQKDCGADVDGSFGPATKKAFMRHMKATTFTQAIRAQQAWLNNYLKGK